MLRYYLLLLQWLTLQSVLGRGDADPDLKYGVPLLYEYSNCSYHNGSSLTLYIINTNQQYKVQAKIYLIHREDGNPALNSELLDLPSIQLLLPEKLATETYQCLRYHCGGTPQSKICTPESKYDLRRGLDIQKLFGVTTDIGPKDSPTTLASIIRREQDFINVVSLMPLINSKHYTYYILHGRERGRYHVPSVGIVQPKKIGPDGLKDPFTINITLNESNVFVYKNLEKKGDDWTFMDTRGTVWLQYQTPTVFKIESPQPLAVFTAFATFNNTLFSYQVRYGQQMPDLKQWGTQFIADFSVIDKYKDVKVSLSILASNSSTVVITTNENTQSENTQSFEMEAEDVKIITIQRGIQYSYMTITSSAKLLILYEAYIETEAKNDTIFSAHLQPIQWHTYKQSVTIVSPTNSTGQLNIIPILAPKGSSVYVGTSHTHPVKLEDYENMTLLRTVDIFTNYTLHTLTHHTSHPHAVGEEKVLLFTANDTNNCSVRLGVTLYTPHYAHTNPPLEDDSNSESESKKCQKLADHTATTIAVSSIVTTLLLLLVLVGVTIVWVAVKRPRILFQKPDPPFKDFDYDVFLSFADGDKELVKTLLYLPLQNKGYKVLWHLSDFIAGLSIAENMLTAIRKSRWVIYACSAHFEESQFCQQELRLGLDDHYRAYGGKYRRVIPLVLKGGICPHKLKQLYPIQAHYNGHTPTNKDIDAVIKRLCFGKSVTVLKEQTRRHRIMTEETETLLNDYNNTEV